MTRELARLGASAGMDDSPATVPQDRQPPNRVSAVEAVRAALTSIRPLVTLSRDGLTLIAVESAVALPRRDYVTFAEAGSDGSIAISEAAVATVPTVEATTREADVLLLGGDTIVGGKQNRIINVTIWLGAASKTPIPVSCLEAGRWNTCQDFAPGRAVDHSMRSMVDEMVHTSVAAAGPVRQGGRNSADYRTNQGGVWQEIGRRHSRASVAAPTAALHDVYAAEAQDLQALVRAFPYPSGAAGLAVGVGGRVVGLDLFDAPETLEHQWSRLVESAASAHLDHTRQVRAGLVPPPRHRHPDPGAVDRLIKRALDALGTATVQPSVGEGDDVRLGGAKVHGSALVNRGRAVHVALFRREA